MVASKFLNADFLRRVFDTGVEVAKPAVQMQPLWTDQIAPWLNEVAPARERVWVYGAGKASAAMASCLEVACQHTERLGGFVVTRRGYSAPTSRVAVVEAAHPVPDEDGQRAAKRLMHELANVPAGDAVIALVSGGGSSLLSVPVGPVPFVDLQHLNRALLACGAPIDEINIVRKHVTRTLGGQLAALCTVPVFQVLVSDVPGDNPSHIASGPFSPDDSSFQDAIDVLQRWGLQPPHSIQRYLERGKRGEVPETPGSRSGVFSRVRTTMIASNAMSLDAVGKMLEGAGYHVLTLGDSLEGEARDVARVVAAMALQVANEKGGWPKPPVAIVSGGECTVTLTDAEMRQAKGGRNSEFCWRFRCIWQRPT
ncbi:MAG: DUF4147 domain-containing protein [Limnobacter sp.]|nr:DUF4147 domain-containing protein [Limnobacter sp.]